METEEVRLQREGAGNLVIHHLFGISIFTVVNMCEAGREELGRKSRGNFWYVTYIDCTGRAAC